MRARRDILARIAALDGRIRAIAKRHATVRLLLTAPGVGPITAMAVVAAFDDAFRFRRSSSADAYRGLASRRYEPGKISHNGRISKRGDGFARKCLFEAANAIFCRNLGDPRLRDWARAIAWRTGPRKAKVALARKLAVTLHVRWRTNTPSTPSRMQRWLDLVTHTTLNFSATECVQSGSGASVISLPGMRPRPRTPLRTTRPLTQTCGVQSDDRGENPRTRRAG